MIHATAGDIPCMYVELSKSYINASNLIKENISNLNLY